MKFSLLSISLLIVSLNVLAQNHRCGFDETLEHLNDEEVKAMNAFEAHYQETLQSPSQGKKESDYIIPIVFHIIHENGNENVSDEDLENLVKQINNDFNLRNSDTASIGAPFKKEAADMQIEFRLARKKPNGSCTNGITRTLSTETREAADNVKNLVKWDNTKYLNIWLVKSIATSSEGTTLGYAYFPGTSSRNDGIVMRSDQMNNNTLTHEIGHYLNLYHTFGGGCQGGSSSNCSRSGDRVCDTPPAADQNFGCPRKINSCSTDFPDLRDQVENYMDYSSCSAMFTLGQKVRMQAAIDFFRGKLVSEANLKETGVSESNMAVAPIAAFDADIKVICPGGQVQFFSNSCHHLPSTEFSWSFDGPTTLSSTDESPMVTFEEQGAYSVTLTVTNDNGTDSKTEEAFIFVNESGKNNKAPYIQRLDADELPDGWIVDYDFDAFKWDQTKSGYDGSGALYIKNYYSPTSNLSTSLTLPPVDISESEDQYLRYHLAYAAIDDNSNDVMSVQVSIDCGKTWRLLKTDVTSSLKTAPNKGVPFSPENQDQWKLFEIDLSRYAAFTDLMVGFVFLSGGGNNVYIDNVTIGSTALSTRELSSERINIYPNPVSSESIFTVSWPSQKASVSIDIVDLSGRMLRSFQMTNTDKVNIPTTGLADGVYHTIITTENSRSNQRIIIQ